MAGVTTLYRPQKEITCELFWRTNLEQFDLVKVNYLLYT